MRPSDHSERLRHCEAVLRENGLPVTVQRRVLIDALLKTSSHPTAEDLFEVGRHDLPDLSRTTVYRVLDTLVDLGLATRVPYPTGAVRYDGDTSLHHHAVCRVCSHVFDVFDAARDGHLRPRGLPAGFRVEDHTVLITGVCRECQRRQ